MNQLLFTKDNPLMADSEEKPKSAVREFGRVWEYKLNINVGKSKVLRLG